MEGRRSHRNRVVAVLTAAWLLAGISALAEEEKQPPIGELLRTSTVYTTSDSAVVEAEQTGTGTPVKATHRKKSNCHLEAISLTGEIKGVGEVSLPTPPDERPFWLVCDGENLGIVWRKISPGTSRPTPPGQVADQLRREIPMPSVSIRVNPGGEGLVGTESWFWIEGYRGGSLSDTTDAFGSIIEVEATPTSYRWDFGDGTVIASSSLGKPYPERSDVRHVYQFSSARFARGFPLSVEFAFAVRYRIDGGAWASLPGITRSARLDYPVRESQAVITR